MVSTHKFKCFEPTVLIGFVVIIRMDGINIKEFRRNETSLEVFNPKKMWVHGSCCRSTLPSGVYMEENGGCRKPGTE